MDYTIKTFDELSNIELYEILKLRNEVFVVEQTCIYNDCDNKDLNSYHLFINNNDNLIAYLRIINKGVSYTEISIGRVLVTKAYRGQGLCRQLMIAAINFIKNNLTEKQIRISAQGYLIKFYESLGFVQVSEEYLEDGIPHIEMLYKLQ